MKQSATKGDWNEWSDQWRGVAVAPAALTRLVEQTARARRAILGLRALSLVVTALALTGVAAALYHAASAFDLGLGFVVAIGICAAWIVDNTNRRDAYGHADEPPARYLAMRLTLCLRRIRFARLVWILAALDLAFLFPWWAGGIRYHGFGFRLVHMTSLWLPLMLIVIVVVAAGRIRARAMQELRSIEPPT